MAAACQFGGGGPPKFLAATPMCLVAADKSNVARIGDFQNGAPSVPSLPRCPFVPSIKNRRIL
ncbi:hypothetical protein MGWOODY_Smn2432 [hydrothermal vent metagenome]|uniref:Uncharacterized protein n=1 Tax=hydrothermal vent metagenome TaxID=652676 RepID=A0A160TGY2_9ZZZZ